MLLEALLQPWTDPASRTFWGGLLAFAVVALVYAWRHRPDWDLRAAVRHPSVRLDVQLLIGRQLLSLLRGVPAVSGAWVVGLWWVRRLDAAFGIPSIEMAVGWTVALYSAVLFVAWDASRWLTHWLMHRVPALWAFHQVHHSAEVLTPLTFHRIHPLESLLYSLRGALVTGTVAGAFFWLFRESVSPVSLLGVPAAGLVLNVLFGNLRHSHVWIRFPAAIERWLLSPAQHQIHHGLDSDRLNYGTWLAIWDRLAGTLALAEAPPTAFGLRQRNHGDDLVSAWFGPLRGAAPILAALGLGLSTTAHAEEVEEEDLEPDTSILITDTSGLTLVAGAAYAVDEESLERFEYDDIERILVEVPGVSTRGEDGFGLRPNIGIRGANSDRSAKITLMEDGVLLAPAPYAAPAAYYFPMTTRMVGVEVFKGPASVRFGPQTVGGALNLRTREVPVGLDYGVDLAAGLRQTGKAHLWAGYGGQRAGILVEAVGLHTAGFKELDTGGPTGFDRGEAMLKGWWSPAPRHRIQLKLGYAQERSYETYTGLSQPDYAANPYRRYAATELDEMAWKRTQAELSWVARPTRNVEVQTTAYHHYNDRTWTKLNGFNGGPDLHTLLMSEGGGQAEVYLALLRGEEDSLSPDQQLMVGTNLRRFHSAGVQSTARLRRYGVRVDHEIEVGARVHHDNVVRLHTEEHHEMVGGQLESAGLEPVVAQDSVSTATAVALHAQDDVVVGRLHLIPGLRTEIIGTRRLDVGVAGGPPQTRAVVLPGMGALVEVSPWVHAFGGAYRGFSPVSPGQPKEVQPETSWNYEAGLRTDTGPRRAEVVGFFNDYQNLTGQCTLSGGCDGDQVGRQFNGGEVWIYGIEATAGQTFNLPRELQLPARASYSWTQSSFRTGFTSDFGQFGVVEPGDSLPYVAEHQLSASVGLRHPRFEVAVGASHRTGMLDAAGDIKQAEVPPLTLLDASLGVQANSRVRLYAVGTNLAGSTAITSFRGYGARPTAPRQVMIGVKVGASPAEG